MLRGGRRKKLRLRLHEDAGVAVAKLREVLLLPAGEAVLRKAAELVVGQVDSGQGKQVHLR